MKIVFASMLGLFALWLVADAAGVQAALGLFLFAWANNIGQQEAKNYHDE